MATAVEAVEQIGSGKPRRGGGRRRNEIESTGSQATRYFLGKQDGASPVFEREVASEQEALLESIRSGQSYFTVSEWRAVADLSKAVPQIRREGVMRKDPK